MAHGTKYNDQRKTDRLSITTDVSVTLGGRMVEGVLFDIGAGGAKVRLTMILHNELNSSSQAVILNIPRFGEFDGEVVWSDGKFVGIQFSENHKAMVSLIREAVTRDAAA